MSPTEFSVPADLIIALPEITNIVELKLLLYFFSRTNTPIDTATAISWPALVRDHQWSRNFSAEELTEGLDSAVAHGFLLELVTGNEKMYWLNSTSGKISKSNEEADATANTEIGELFIAYEENIGPITPIIADAVIHASDEYSKAWIDEAIGIAVKMNKRNWKYIEAILKRWKEEGHGTIPDRRDTEKNDPTGRSRSRLEEFLNGD